MSRQVARPETPLAAKIQLAQAETGLTNEELARRIGVSVRLLQKWRAGTTKPLHRNTKRLARVLGQPVDWFYEEDRAA